MSTFCTIPNGCVKVVSPPITIIFVSLNKKRIFYKLKFSNFSLVTNFFARDQESPDRYSTVERSWWIYSCSWICPDSILVDLKLNCVLSKQK
jgi:hypothetical protein